MNIFERFVSHSPYNEAFTCVKDERREREKILSFIDSDRPLVVVQGLGFVGSAVSAAIACAVNAKGEHLYNVIGVDLPDPDNYWKIARVNNGLSPIKSADGNVDRAYKAAHAAGNLMATWLSDVYGFADVVIVDINLDVEKTVKGRAAQYSFTLENYCKALLVLADTMKERSLVVIESTVPPGTTAQVIQPLFEKAFEARGLDSRLLYLVHSYERVMPGTEYLHSITDYYRVFAGINDESAKKGRAFFETFINTREYPLSELASTTDSEMAKVLENSYRAMNIAFMQEWTELAEKADVNLFQVIDAIRTRKTHRNIMSPGFGVGGYCLTKDSLLADWASTNYFNEPELLKMSVGAVDVNDLMPAHTFKRIKSHIEDMSGKRVIVFGVSYLNDVADTRHSPSEYFVELCHEAGMETDFHDPLVETWKELSAEVRNSFVGLEEENYDIAVFTVRHKEYLKLTAEEMIKKLPHARLIVDANNIISDEKAEILSRNGRELIGIGKGHWKKYGK